MNRHPSSSVVAAIAACALVVTAALAACATYTHDPKALFQSSWKTGYKQISECAQSGDGHRNAHVVVYVNAAGATAPKAGPFPEGTVFLKAQYSDDKCTSLDTFTAMKKGPPGTAANSGDWLWQAVSSSGEIKASGKIGSCIDCHSGADTDYVFTER